MNVKYSVSFKRVNERTTNCTELIASEAIRTIQNCKIGDYSFEEIKGFTYLKIDVNNAN